MQCNGPEQFSLQQEETAYPYTALAVEGQLSVSVLLFLIERNLTDVRMGSVWSAAAVEAGRGVLLLRSPDYEDEDPDFILRASSRDPSSPTWLPSLSHPEPQRSLSYYNNSGRRSRWWHPPQSLCWQGKLDITRLLSRWLQPAMLFGVDSALVFPSNWLFLMFSQQSFIKSGNE